MYTASFVALWIGNIGLLAGLSSDFALGCYTLATWGMGAAIYRKLDKRTP